MNNGEQPNIFSLYEQTLSGAPKFRELNVVNTSNVLDQSLNRRKIAGKPRHPSPAIDNENVFGLRFRHHFYRVRRDHHLLMTCPQISDQTALEIRMHIHIWLIENHTCSMTYARQKPHRLEPHLKTVAHRSDFGREVLVAHIEVKPFTWIASACLKIENSSSRPRLLDHSPKLSHTI